ncbi:unnamed protein product, partial [marine sediment metagenome]
PRERPDMREVAQELRAWQSLAEQPIPPTDVSDVVNQIKLLSKPLFDSQDRMSRSVKEARRLTKQLLLDFEPMAKELEKTGLRYNKPSNNGKNLLEGSGLQETQYGTFGVTVSMYTPNPPGHIFECGIMIQVLDDTRHHLYAAYHIREFGRETKPVHSTTAEVKAGSAVEQQQLDQMVELLYTNLKNSLQQFAMLLE